MGNGEWWTGNREWGIGNCFTGQDSTDNKLFIPWMIIGTRVWPNWTQRFSAYQTLEGFFPPSVSINLIRDELTEYCWMKYFFVCLVPIKTFLFSGFSVKYLVGKIHKPPPHSHSSCQYKHSFCPELMELMSLVQSRGTAKPGSYQWRAQTNRFTRQEHPWHLILQGHKLHCRGAHSKTPSQMCLNQSSPLAQGKLIFILKICTTGMPKISLGITLF